MKKKILFVANVDWFFISHRLVIAEEAIVAGYEVFVAAEDTGRSNEIVNRGIGFIDLSFSRSGTNVFIELRTLSKFFRIYRDLKPDIVHHVTLKPVIYGSLIARVLKVRGVVNAVSGLGFNFTENRVSITKKIMLKLMKIGFNRSGVSVIFQNRDDFQELANFSVISELNKVWLIKGSGVDLTNYFPTEFPDFSRVKILFPSRMLWDKGIMELLDASLILKNEYFNKIEIVLAGMLDDDNKAGITREFINSWSDGYYVNWIGYCKNMQDIYSDSHIVILPSYREGMPKALIEACAMGRAIITTDAIGCRECVDHGINGLRVPVKDAKALSLAIKELVDNKDEVVRMGKASRLKAISEFDIRFVIDAHLKIYRQY